MDESEETLPFNNNPKVKKNYERCAKKEMSIITLNLADSQLAYIRSCK